MLRTFVIAAALLAVCASSARADMPQYQGQRPANIPQLQAMIDRGNVFWQQRHVDVGGPVQFYLADDVGQAQDGLSVTPFEGMVFCRSLRAVDYGVNRIVCRADWVREMRKEMRDRVLGLGYTEYVCAVLWHEEGHMGGLALPALVDGQWTDTHPAEGLMSQQLTPPGDCRVLARSTATVSRRLTKRSRLAPNRHQGQGRMGHRAVRH